MDVTFITHKTEMNHIGQIVNAVDLFHGIHTANKTSLVDNNSFQAFTNRTALQTVLCPIFSLFNTFTSSET